ncbi:ATP synthase gamma chain 1, chloroplastic-like [Rosa rugosa]|uniref:ATP synthase gamma chain 1, chloroplastic-like n=1 Tax=Rosa rugosa TaxID=74645 RepID=UPI002B402A9B|nr:ATP synthase gamma chain 1, chloroplastic-like [Rosa rugosa]
MKLVAAARVRRAQDAVINGRPFSETLVEVLYDINEQLQGEDVDIPLTNVRPVKKVALVVITSDRGLCGGFNNALTKKAHTRIVELRKFGLEVVLISVGKKGNSYFMRRLEIKSPSQSDSFFSFDYRHSLLLFFLLHLHHFWVLTEKGRKKGREGKERRRRGHDMVLQSTNVSL